jgi:serine phosphatase RsbU (regulator of sigma subunit)
VESQIAGDGNPAIARPRGTELAGLASFTLDGQGRLASWPATAGRLFGHSAAAVVGHHVRDVLTSGPDQRQLLDFALAEVAAGRVWTGILTLTDASGGGQVAVRCEPMGGPGSGVLAIAQRASPPPGPSLLTEATARVGSTLNLAQTATEVVDVTVPGFADAATIYVPERLLAADELGSHPPSHSAVVRRLASRLAGHPATVTDGVLRSGEVVVLGADAPCFRAMSTGRPVLFDRLDRETAARIGGRPGGVQFTSCYTSFLAVPLAARGAVVGCLAFGRAARRDAFGPADVALAAELASHAAVCIDNARLYDRERRTALALQRSLLPARPQVPAGLEIAGRYQSVGANVVGGDWHDIVPLEDGRAALIVGDAMGHGPEAAAVMVQLRTAAHILADLELDPEEILRRLDRMAAGLAASPFATCIYTIIDPSASSCVIAQAGHLPPVLVLPGGATRVLDLPPGLPLGLDAGTFQASQITLPPGATLALYTDGLVESRTRPLDRGMAALREALGSVLAQPPSVLGDSCEAVIERLREHGEDDITLVLARICQ